MGLRVIISILIPIVLCVNSVSVVANDRKGATKTQRLHQHLIKQNKKLKTRNELITIILESDTIDDVSHQKIKSHGGKIRFKSGKKREIKIPASKLNKLLENLPESFHARLPYPHQALSVVSQGVDIMGASDMQSIGNGGEGIKVGIIDLGFTSYTKAQASGDLPAVLSIVDYTGSGTGGTNHGTNVAEIVHDMAPGAELYLAKVGSTLQLEQAVNDMLSAGVHIINHSVAWFGAAFYDGTGPICDITDNAEASGMHWVNAVGNSRATHYLGAFSDVDGDLRHEFASAQNNNTISLKSGKSYTLILNWDAYPVTNVDYNLYLYNGDPDAGGTLVGSSTDSQRGGASSYPYEAITYTAVTTAIHYIVITKKKSSTANLPLTLFSTGPALGTKTFSSSVVQPADCASVLSVGATDLTDGAEYFSSEGPTTDGRNKPEISATNGTLTSLSSSFTGTSGASPHVAGAAALLLSQNPLLSVSGLRNLLVSTAHDVSTTGFDSRTGYGRVSLDADQDAYNHDDDNCPLNVNSSQLDTDFDTLGNACDVDDDNDGLSDSFESSIGTNSLLIDTDTDGLSDYFEVGFDGDFSLYTLGSDLDPLSIDTDGDTISDYDEISFDGDSLSYVAGVDLNPLSIDTDGDSLSDSFEIGFDGDVLLYTVGSDLDPLSVDTDGDTISDYDEISFDGDSSSYVAGVDLNPLSIDTDGDSLSDSFEIGFDGDVSLYVSGSDLDPLSIDTDGDTISDYDEISLDGDSSSYAVGVDLNPLSIDTDGDTFQDDLDPIPLNFNYADGDVAPLGAPDGIVNVADYVILQQIYNGLIVPSISELSHADVYPADMPDGVIEMSDIMVIQQNILQ